MRAGNLRHKIDIQSYTVAPSSYGEPVKTWANTLSSRWASVQYLSGSEGFGGEGMPERLASQTAIFVIRYSSISIDQTMRVVHGSKNWNILRIEDVNYRHREQRIWAELIE